MMLLVKGNKIPRIIMKKLCLLALSIGLIACNSDTSQSSSADSLSTNTTWPYEIIGSVDIHDAGFSDSQYADWAIGSIVSGDDDILIMFDNRVLRAAGIGSEFNFSDPTTLLLGAPTDEYGESSYPVEAVQ